MGLRTPHLWGSCFLLCTPGRRLALPSLAFLPTLSHTHTTLTHNLITTTYSLTHTHKTFSHFTHTHTQLTATHTHNSLTHTTFSHTTYSQQLSAAVCVAGLAFGSIGLRSVWQAGHLATSTCTLCGRRGTYGTGLALVVRGTYAGRALVVRLVSRGRRCCLCAWHSEASASILCGRRGIWQHRLYFVWQPWHSWHWVGSRGWFPVSCLSHPVFNFPLLLSGRRWHVSHGQYSLYGWWSSHP